MSPLRTTRPPRSALLVPLLLALSFPVTGEAAPWIAVHVVERDTGACDAMPLLSCWSYTTSGRTLREYDVYVVAQGIPASEGIAGGRFGLDYDPGVTIHGITRCATGQQTTPDWPASGSGTMLSFDPVDDCRRTDVDGHGARAVLAVFRISAAEPGMFRVTGHPGAEDASVAGCGGADHPVDPSDLGRAAFSPDGAAVGFNSCTRPPGPGGPLVRPRIAPHVAVVNGGADCDAPRPVHSDRYVVRGGLDLAHHVYLVAHDHDSFGSGMAGASFGIEYTAGLAVTDWTSCSTLEFASPGWPGSGEGIVTTWSPETQCQRDVAAHGVEAILGVLTVQAAEDASLRITPRNYLPQPDLKLASCGSAEANLNAADVGVAGFGGGLSYDVCTGESAGTEVVPVRSTTWGALKRLYGGGD